MIHHVDLDEENDVPENLVPAHRSCHNSHHFKHKWENDRELMMQKRVGMTGKRHSDETKFKISEAKKGRRLGPEVYAKIAEKNRGQKRSPEAIANLKEGARKRAENRKIRKAGGMGDGVDSSDQ